MKTIVTVKGTHCTACKTLIEEVCMEIEGVSKCVVDFQTGKTEITHSKPLDKAALKKGIESLGAYKVEV
ncbi:MAG: heavy metal-associated domain-containing protein [Nanoarchaeota archaeon]